MENDDGTIALADAFVTYAPGGGLSAAMGQQTLPFGVYDTNLVSDPLTKELGETALTSLVLGGEAAPFGWSLFTYYVDDEETIDGFGVGLGTAWKATIRNSASTCVDQQHRRFRRAQRAIRGRRRWPGVRARGGASGRSPHWSN